MPPGGGAALICNRTNWAGTLVQLLYSGRRLIFLAPMEACCLLLRRIFEIIPEQIRRDWPLDPEHLRESLLFTDLLPDISEAGIMPLLKKTGPGRAKEGFDYYQKFLAAARKMVDRGDTIAIYGEHKKFSSRPEGSLGLATRLALRARVPLIPAAIRGPGRLENHGFRFDSQSRPVWTGTGNSDRTVIYRIGRPLLPANYPEGEDKRALKILTAELREQLCRLGERRRRCEFYP